MEVINLPSTCQGALLAHYSLADDLYWRTGGVADYVYKPAGIEDLSLFLSALSPEIPLTFIGLGSNTLVRDKGVEGVVILTQGALNQLQTLSTCCLRAEAGVASAQLARYSARLGLSGLEFLAGIPGTVGGALAMNAGCFGGETWPWVSAVETIDRYGVRRLRQPDDYIIRYREVISPQGEWFIAGHFTLNMGDKEHSLSQIRQLLEKRNLTQPTGTANCGSVFRNPQGDYAGRLIECCELKGTQLGGALVSEKHANFILNNGEASARDIEQLILLVQETVREKTGISLTPEVCIIGRE